ncbi:MAG: hypothetical protein L0I24_19315 [Pseudonocardia sp.]|nr:hypothetical protein [Pseudonocardia sp.]
MNARTLPRLRPAGRCAKCRTPMMHRPHGATVAVLPRGRRFLDGRGLCTVCLQAARKIGGHVDYPRRTRTRDELLDDWALVRDEGSTYAQFAQRLGMSTSAVLRALTRARAAGDPRARYALNRRSTGAAA